MEVTQAGFVIHTWLGCEDSERFAYWSGTGFLQTLKRLPLKTKGRSISFEHQVLSIDFGKIYMILRA